MSFVQMSISHPPKIHLQPPPPKKSALETSAFAPLAANVKAMAFPRRRFVASHFEQSLREPRQSEAGT